ncbi:hypothetical protein GCM10029976_063890 [Kribbella albertanoniae]|uniref:DUF4097 domain-containing protein n=1 Tax=Kribbella albertanoniae TaxID=1266829 RepID=A0A4V2XNR1_9ACTN|nr:DUF4097 family beta strand repeat-containing protein [Kribbella albertanoniae]TDC19236.1 hypothetical protein E1261_34390 [Kribbella albertanoniae]
MESKQLGVAVLVIAAGVGLWQFGDKDGDDERRIDAKIDTVRLAANNADITIKVSDDDTTTVNQKRHYWFVSRGDAYSVDGSTLKLDGDCGWNCSADYEVTVPRGTKVVGENGSGDLSLTGVAGVDAKSRSGEVDLHDVGGDVKLDLTSGDVSIQNLTGRLNIKANSGDIDAEGLRGGPVEVETSSGDIGLDLVEANDIRVKGTSGDVDITAPGGYRVTTDTRSGEVENTLGNDTAGMHSLTASTVSGDIDLRRN